MKNKSLLFFSLCFSVHSFSQNLTLITGKRLYEHHSSSLSGMPYGFDNLNQQSGYDFIKHAYIGSASTNTADKDMIEHNGCFGSLYGNFGFTSAISNIGSFNYTGNNKTTFVLSSLSFQSLNTLEELKQAYQNGSVIKMDTSVKKGNLYIGKIRDGEMYIALNIVDVKNLNIKQIDSVYDQLNVFADVYFDFDYKYGLVATGIGGGAKKSIPFSVSCVPGQNTLRVSGMASGGFYKIINAIGQECLTGTLSEEGLVNVEQLKPNGLYYFSADTESPTKPAAFIRK